MAFPLIALAATLAPELIRLLAGDRAGRVADAVSGAVRDVTGTTDPAAARAALDADPARADALRVRLAEIALEAARAADAAEATRQASGLESLRASLADVASARDRMTDLARTGSGLAWGPATISTLVVIGFFAVLVLLVTLDGGSGGARFDPQVASVVNITVGALGAAFAAVVNFWIGSSQGSREKDAIVGRLSEGRFADSRPSEARSDVTRTATLAAPRVAAPAAPTLSLVASAAPAAAASEERFDRCLSLVLAQEGGFSNDPRDPGGATNLGITRATLSAFRETEATVEDVRALTRAEAREIYRSRYWTPLRCEVLPPGLDLYVFDYGVNAGPGRAARLLQRVVGVVQDGSIGPITLAALAARRPETVIAGFAEGRLEHYRSLSTFAVFGRGWTRRTEEMRREALAMAAAPAPVACAA